MLLLFVVVVKSMCRYNRVLSSNVKLGCECGWDVIRAI